MYKQNYWLLLFEQVSLIWGKLYPFLSLFTQYHSKFKPFYAIPFRKPLVWYFVFWFPIFLGKMDCSTKFQVVAKLNILSTFAMIKWCFPETSRSVLWPCDGYFFFFNPFKQIFIRVSWLHFLEGHDSDTISRIEFFPSHVQMHKEYCLRTEDPSISSKRDLKELC